MKKYHFLDNWSGRKHEFNSLIQAKSEAKKQTGNAVTIFDNNGVKCIVHTSNQSPIR